MYGFFFYIICKFFDWYIIRYADYYVLQKQFSFLQKKQESWLFFLYLFFVCTIMERMLNNIFYLLRYYKNIFFIECWFLLMMTMRDKTKKARSSFFFIAFTFKIPFNIVNQLNSIACNQAADILWWLLLWILGSSSS